jgi:drug/metabolite transporter (DMT)-like permease
MHKETTVGHLAALISILIWGTTFISTKVLLTDFTPIEILLIRSLLGLLVLMLLYPKPLKPKSWKEELLFAAAGLCGICLYYLLENIALTYTMASNVGVTVSVSPFFTAILSHLFLKTGEKLKASFLVGFVVAIAGICLISWGGSQLELNPVGDLLAILAAAVWAVYSLLTRKISAFGYNTVQSTRRIFLYGILFMVPALFLFGFDPNFSSFTKPEVIFNFLYLGIGASALCFVTWNHAVKKLGAVKTSVYIYLIPVITMVTSAIVLQEQITVFSVAGAALTLLGLLLSEGASRWFKKKS